MSTARAEWVSAPTEMKSTPVLAIAAAFSKFTPPLASVFARALAILTAYATAPASYCRAG